MTTKNPTKSSVSKSTIALFVVAAVFAVNAGIGRTGGAAALPDPGDMALLAVGRSTPAENVDHWKSRIAEDPDVAQFRVHLANAQLELARETGDLELYETAETEAAIAVDLDPEAAAARLTLADAHAGQHEFSDALKIAQSVLAEDPSSAAALLAVGDAHLELGDVDDAEAAFRAAEAELGGTPALLSRFARLSSLRGDTVEAAELARRALIGAADIDLPRSGAAFYWLQLAHYRFQTGQYDDAEKLARSALTIEPGHLGATELLGRILGAQGRDDEAIAVYEELIDRSPAPDLHGELAKLFDRVGRADDASAQVEEGLELGRATADRFPAERRHLIGFFADHDPAEALRLAELDLAERQDIHSHAWYAWALLQNGDARAALDAIAPALSTGTDDPWIRYQAGAIHAANQMPTEAASMLTAALDMNPEFDIVHAERARELLADL